jgi:hypothetical protein
MQQNRIHDWYKEGRLPSKKDLVKTFIGLKIHRNEDLICPVDTRKILTMDEIVLLKPESKDWEDYKRNENLHDNALYETLNHCEGYEFFNIPELILHNEVLRADARNFSREYYFGKEATPKLIKEDMERYTARMISWELAEKRDWKGYSPKEVERITESIKESWKEGHQNRLENALYDYKNSYNYKPHRSREILIISRLGNKLHIPNDSILLDFSQENKKK